MDLALISDLHGNVPALDAVLADIARFQGAKVVCLGDVVDLGPDPGEVISILREREIPCLMGNHDPFLGEPIVPVDVYEWTGGVLTEQELAWLRALPPELEVEIDAAKVLCVHGSPRSFDEQILPTTSNEELDAMVGNREFDVLACGHTHVQFKRKIGARWIVNCGSVAMPFTAPFTGDVPPRVQPWAEYAIVHGHSGRVEVELCRVEYDIEAYFGRVRQSSMPNPEAWLANWVAP